MLVRNNLSSIFVLDQDRALEFYVGLLGLEVSADMAPRRPAAPPPRPTTTPPPRRSAT